MLMACGLVRCLKVHQAAGQQASQCTIYSLVMTKIASWKITMFHRKIHYSMMIFHSYVKLPEGTIGAHALEHFRTVQLIFCP